MDYYGHPDIRAILSKDGIEYLGVSFIYTSSGEGSNAAAIIPPEKAAEALAQDVLLNAPDDQFARADLDKAELCYMPRYGNLGEGGSFPLTPAWVFSGTYDKYFEGETGPRNPLYMAVDAITGEFITALPLNPELSKLLIFS